MRIQKKANSGVLEGDLTPMIDMTFQLIAFFMVLINFTQSEQHEKVQLPDSVLAKPQKEKLEHPITIHMTEDGTVIIAGTRNREISIENLKPHLDLQKGELRVKKLPIGKATIVIRAHKDSQTKDVQDLIQECKDAGFTVFKLRAKEDVGN